MDPAIAKRREGYAPYKLAATQRGETVELISYPYPEEGDTALFIQARTEVNDPTTMRRFRCDELVPYTEINRLLFVGTLAEGFRAYGPLQNNREAANFDSTLTLPIEKVENVWSMPLIQPYEDEHRTPLDGVENEPYVILWGDPMTGYIGVGPFDCLEDAEEYSGNLHGEVALFPLDALPAQEEE